MVLDFTEEDKRERENVDVPIIEQRESIKLIKSQKGTYAWEIKILSLDVEQLKKIDAQLKEAFNI